MRGPRWPRLSPLPKRARASWSFLDERLLDDWQRSGNLKIHDREQLMLDLEEPDGDLRRQRGLHALITFLEDRLAFVLEVEHPSSESIGRVVADVAVLLAVFVDER